MSRKRLRAYLLWGFALSIVLHLILGPLAGRLRFTEPEQPEQVTKAQTLVLETPPATPPPPTPKPTVPPTPPPPTPTPPPQTPPPTQPPTVPPTVPPTAPPAPKAPAPPHHEQPPQAHLKLDVPKVVSRAEHVPEEPAYHTAPGTENGAPKGGDAGPGTGNASTGSGTGAGNGTGTGTPSCAQPHVDAATKDPVQPDYPEIAREQGASGTARVKVTLDSQGKVVAASILQTTGNTALDQEAIKAAKASTYTPEVVDCRPVGGSYVFTAEFQAE